MADTCASCNVGLGTLTQLTLGKTVELLCIGCQTQKRARGIVTLLPEEHERDFEAFTEWEQGFVTDMRRRLENPDYQVSEKQLEVLERLHRKT